ncbi:hypothetical protein [Maridesulfovibrio hydrothermalis]|uniref:Iron-sulfur cluster-binding protein n=1 Tax=Maridesulfovibrio hydrothermalis AM13 = DSM 14728 TaxID=1121451 RepID=L0R9V5_9BACT|nr:hypothetical protein [Maridesulfovibrio hydrothermalis]CCO22366.1 Iron-sulfur cluster-binding protein [Maridesulfovibrio hydrothermalis AM13 = DSM 14728]
MNNIMFARFFKISVFVMALTGVAQMPIFKRYYIADIPGMGWLADYYITNKIHYIFGAVLLFMVTRLITEFVLTRKQESQFTLSGVLRVGLYGAVMVTGVLRVIKNLSAVTMDPYTVMLIDWTHLGFAALLGVVAMTAFFRGRVPYLSGGRG